MKKLLAIALFFVCGLFSVLSQANCTPKQLTARNVHSVSHSKSTHSVARPLSGRPFHVITWNVNLMSSWTIAQWFLYYFDHQDMNDILTRAQIIANNLKQKNYDIIALQELADHASKKIIDSILAEAGYYSSEMLGEKQSHLGWAIYLFNGGITLYSKHPFQALEYHFFSRPAGLQYYMPKGAIYGKVKAGDKVIHVFNVHLQSIHEGKSIEYEVQRTHLNDLRDLIKSKHYEPDEHIFVMGDFNIDSQNYLPVSPGDAPFNTVLKTLRASEAVPFDNCTKMISFDPAENAMAKGKFPLGTLDNILCLNSRTCPYSGSKRIFRFEDTQTRLKELSDHYPVEALIYIP